MKNIIIIAILALGFLSASAQQLTPSKVTPTVLSTNSVESDKSEPWTVELTLGGGSVVVPKTGNSETSVDFSIEVNPFKRLPNVWVGVQQSVAWSPTFAGSTDLIGEYSWHVYKNLWLNTGWTVGAEYDTLSSALWRTGPALTAQYYVGENAFIYAGANYDLVQWGNTLNKGVANSEVPIRFSWGIGLSF